MVSPANALPVDRLVERLRRLGLSKDQAHAIDLLILHGRWLCHRQFIDECVWQDGDVAGIDWIGISEFLGRLDPDTAPTDVLVLDLASQLARSQFSKPAPQLDEEVGALRRHLEAVRRDRQALQGHTAAG